MPAKRNNKKFTRKHQGQTSPLSSATISSNNDGISDNNINPPTTLTFEILLDQLKMTRDENQRLKKEIENLQEKLMNKAIVDAENIVLHLPRIVLNQSIEEDDEEGQQQQQNQQHQDEKN